MSNRAQLGHNRGGSGRMYAIVFDLDQDTLGRLYHVPNANNAYSDIRRFLTSQGFEWMQGSTYFCLLYTSPSPRD